MEWHLADRVRSGHQLCNRNDSRLHGNGTQCNWRIYNIKINARTKNQNIFDSKYFELNENPFSVIQIIEIIRNVNFVP